MNPTAGPILRILRASPTTSCCLNTVLQTPLSSFYSYCMLWLASSISLRILWLRRRLHKACWLRGSPLSFGTGSNPRATGSPWIWSAYEMRAMGIMGERCKCHVSLAIAYFVHGPSQELGTPRGRSEAGRVEGGQAFSCWIGDYRGLLSVVDAAHSRIAISLLAVPQQPLSWQVTA